MIEEDEWNESARAYTSPETPTTHGIELNFIKTNVN
jgi:hypothetical protein